MARAKRTSRAEARRRYRDLLAEQAAAETPEEEPAPTPPKAVAKPGRPEPKTAHPAPDRPVSATGSIAAAFRGSFRPANIREDLAGLPALVRSRAVWGPSLAVIVVTGVYLATSGHELVSTLLLPYFVVPPPIGAIFIAGFFAPRASYLVGLIVGLVATFAFVALVAAAGPGGILPGATPTPTASPSASASASLSASPGVSASPSAAASASAGTSPSPGSSPAASGSPSPSSSPETTPKPIDTAGAITYAFSVSPISGIFFAAAAAWYRRFLRMANPNRGRPQAQRQRNPRRR